MPFLFAALAVVVLGGAAMLITGRLGGLPEPERDRRKYVNPDAPISPLDAENIRFGVVFRGYRMDDVDETIEALTETIRMREAQLAALSSVPVAANVAGVTDVPAVGQEQPNSPVSGAIGDTAD